MSLLKPFRYSNLPVPILQDPVRTAAAGVEENAIRLARAQPMEMEKIPVGRPVTLMRPTLPIKHSVHQQATYLNAGRSIENNSLDILSETSYKQFPRIGISHQEK